MMKTKRRAGDSIRIGDVTVHVLKITESHAELGIDAPKNVPIHVESGSPTKPGREDKHKPSK